MKSRSLKKSSRRQMQKEETRRIIMASAYSLFGSKGYEKTTMRELAEHADVGLGTIFKHFPDKSSLLISTFQEDIEAVIQNSLDTMPTSNIKMQLAHIATELYDFLGLNPSFSRNLLRETLFPLENHAEPFRKPALSFMEKIGKVFIDAIERGELDRRTDSRVGALTFLSFFFMGLIGRAWEPEFGTRKQTFFFAALLENYFSGVMETK